MKLAVITNEILKEEFLLKMVPSTIEPVFINSVKTVPADADVIFDLLFEHNAKRIFVLKEFLPKPVFINSVNTTLAKINLPFIRMNAWPGFFKRNITEIAALLPEQDMLQHVFKLLGWSYRLVPDTSGMISGRILAMIINEAYFTFGSGVSTKEEIDIAMKLGTNYPYGPFEWGKLIGLSNVYQLLVSLNEENKRYEIAQALIAEVSN